MANRTPENITPQPEPDHLNVEPAEAAPPAPNGTTSEALPRSESPGLAPNVLLARMYLTGCFKSLLAHYLTNL